MRQRRIRPFLTGVSILAVVALVSLFGFYLKDRLHPNPASAASAASWQAGTIISDGIFYNNNAMTVSDIQDFLNQKVSNCDTSGTQMHSSTMTDAQYAATQGWPGPSYVCLKDYYQVPRSDQIVSNLSTNVIPSGAISAAQIIKNASDAYGVNPEVLLVTLEKESLNLLEDNWPLPSQYTAAMGYGCSDNAPCDPQYAGFYNQITNAARQFQLYKTNASSYRYKSGQANTILYNPSTSCGSSSVTITTTSTAGLYNYTPYQPDQAALNNLYGTGDSCSAYGNRNFWRIFTDWFGNTINTHLDFSVIQGPGSPAIYLQTWAGKYYIPSGDLMKDWGIDTLPVQQVSQTYLDNLPTNAWLGRTVKDDWGNLYFVDGGTLHYVQNSSLASLWNLDPNNAVQSLGIIYTLPASSWVSRFVRDSSLPTGQVYLVDKGTKHAISGSDLLSQWGYTPSLVTPVTTAFLASMPTGDPVSRFATDGTNKYLIDSGNRLTLGDATTQSAYDPTSVYTTYDANTLSLLTPLAASTFGVDGATGQWFMFEGGRKHYISNSNLADLWGKQGKSLTPLSDVYVGSVTDGGNLSYVVQTASPAAYWVIDGNKRYIADSNTADAWLGTGVSPPLYSDQSVAALAQAGNATAMVHDPQSPYTYEMISGTKHYLPDQNTKNAWGNNTISISTQLVSNIPEGAYASYMVESTGGQGYLLMNGSKYTIDSSFNDVWGIGSSTPVVTNGTLARFTTAATVKAFVNIGGTSYVMTPGRVKVSIKQYNDAYQPASNGETTLPSDYFSTANDASFLATSSSGNVWLISGGKKTLLNFSQEVSFGYLSRGIPLTTLTPATINLIPDSGVTPSILIQKQGSGIKLLDFGSALGFPDSSTLLSYIPTQGVMTVSGSIYDTIPLTGTTSKVVVDDANKYYLISGGQKHWVTNGAAYAPYASIPRVYLYGTTMALIPDGAAIN